MTDRSDRRASWASSPATRATMQANRSRNTKPEIALRSAVHRLGLRYRICTRPLPDLRRSADLVFTRAKVAVFLDGCFWHGCPQHGSLPAANRYYWQANSIATRSGIRRPTATWLMLGGWLCASGSTRILSEQQPASP